MYRAPTSLLVIIIAWSLVSDRSALAMQELGSAKRIVFAEDDQKVTVKIDDEVFTNYFKQGYAKPILYPIYGPGQIGMTRNWPMQVDVAGEAHDHPHHKSLWFSHEINGIDFWTENEGTVEVTNVELNGESNEICADSIWIRRLDGKTILSDTTIYRFGFDNSSRWIDATITILATGEDLTFEDTKEGSFGLRTHPNLRLTSSPKEGVTQVHGSAQNSSGASGKSIWGKPAKWVMYSGPIDGMPMSIAIFDHPTNLRHPTTWHARDYGLVAANPFGLHDFLGKKKGAGAYKINQSDSLTLRYRVVFIKGIATPAEVNKRFDQFANDE